MVDDHCIHGIERTGVKQTGVIFLVVNAVKLKIAFLSNISSKLGSLIYSSGILLCVCANKLMLTGGCVISSALLICTPIALKTGLTTKEMQK